MWFWHCYDNPLLAPLFLRKYLNELNKNQDAVYPNSLILKECMNLQDVLLEFDVSCLG